jgi:hypothetical protein
MKLKAAFVIILILCMLILYYVNHHFIAGILIGLLVGVVTSHFTFSIKENISPDYLAIIVSFTSLISLGIVYEICDYHAWVAFVSAIATIVGAMIILFIKD